MTLERMSGRLDLDSGDIQVSDVAGAAKLRTSNKDLDVENVGGRLEIADVHGDIKVGYAKPPLQEISITNESGGVDLTLPAKSNFQISASSKGGDVQSDFDGSSDTGGDTPRFNAKKPPQKLSPSLGGRGALERSIVGVTPGNSQVIWRGSRK